MPQLWNVMGTSGVGTRNQLAINVALMGSNHSESSRGFVFQRKFISQREEVQLKKGSNQVSLKRALGHSKTACRAGRGNMSESSRVHLSETLLSSVLLQTKAPV